MKPIEVTYNKRRKRNETGQVAINYFLKVKYDYYTRKQQQYDFYITDGIQAWDGGIGCPYSDGEEIRFRDIPRRLSRVRDRLYLAKLCLDEGNACTNLEKSTFTLPKGYKYL